MKLILIEDPDHVSAFRINFKQITGQTVEEFKETASLEAD